jgi:hypothetical protein
MDAVSMPQHWIALWFARIVFASILNISHKRLDDLRGYRGFVGLDPVTFQSFA